MPIKRIAARAFDESMVAARSLAFPEDAEIANGIRAAADELGCKGDDQEQMIFDLLSTLSIREREVVSSNPIAPTFEFK